MDAQELRNLREAYFEVVENQQLDEALTGERYKKVMKKPGGTAYSRKVSADPAKRATRGGKGGESDFGAGDRGSGNKAARRAGTYQEEEVSVYDIILSHLLDEGYAETPEAAEAIMVSMSEGWREEIMEGVRPTPVDKPLDKPAFKKRRRSLAGREASADARARGHEGKTWADSGRTYSPDEAKSRRKNMSDTHRSLSYGTAESPDDNTGYPAVKTKNPKKLRKQKAMGEHG